MTNTKTHVWITEEGRVGPDAVARLREVLSQTERDRADRYRREGDRRRSVVARGLARLALSRFDSSAAPEDWEIVAEEDGRPVVADGPWFSVTHTSGLVAVAVSVARVGIDAENRTRDTDVDAVGRRWLHPREYQAMAGSEDAERRRRFFRFWTLKEAYSKALGLGLKLGLKSFCVHLETPVRITVDRDDLRGWTFQTYEPTAEHVLALAIEAPAVDVEWIEWSGDPTDTTS